jgi:hypothetical protein
VTKGLGLVFREQGTSDFGVDAQAEMKREGRPIGRLVGLQIKTGPSYFEESYEDGWIFRPKDRHVQYWLNHSLPVYVLLVDLDTESIYWQEITEQQLQTGPRGGVSVRIPRANVLATARGPWEIAAEKFASTAAEDYEDNLDHLAPSTTAILRRLADMRAGEAALLCAHLARGRHAPELTARTLLVSTPPWLANLGADGYAALADFARSYGVDALAAEVLLAGAGRFPSRTLRFTTSAGMILLNSDHDQAHELLESAEAKSSGFNARVEIGLLILGHADANTAPVSIPAEVASRLAAIEDDAVVFDFLARQSAMANDLDAAVNLAEKALAIEPDEWQLIDNLADLLTRRSLSVRRRPDDQRRAVELAERAVDQLHRWDGPTRQALRTLLRVMTLAGSLSKILDRTLPSPNGYASEQEATRPEVISAAAAAARELGRAELADALIDSLPDGIDKQFAVLRRDTPSGNPESDRVEWAALLDALDETRPEQLVLAVMRLADLGVDRSDRLDKMVKTSMITLQVQALASATAAAVRDLPSGLPALRVLSDTDDMAAEKMIGILAATDRFDDAQAAALGAYSRFGEPGFLVEAAELLKRLNRPEEASAAANEALGHSELDALRQRGAHRILAHIAIKDAESAAGTEASTRSWRRAEHHLAECISSASGLRPDVHDVWNLIHVQLKLGAPARAFATLSAHNPEVSSKYEAMLWADVINTQPGDAAAFAQMLDMADRFDDDPQFSGALLSAVIGRTRDEGQQQATPADTRLELANDLRARAFAALGSHAERHGEASPFQVIQAPSAEELLGKMTEIMRQDHAPLLDLLEMIRQVRVPMGMLSTMLGDPYSFTLAQRGLGYFIAAAGSDADDAADESAAIAARDGDVVVDISALLISSLLGEFEYSRGQFRTLFAPTVSRQDIAAGHRRLDGRSAGSGSVFYDAARGSAVASGPDIDGHLAALERFAKLELALARTQLTSAPPLSSLGELTIEGAEAWLAPIAVAKERGLCLWSDDVAQRRLARACGVGAFGTTTLQQLRAAERLDAEDTEDTACAAVLAARRAEVMTALSERIADVPADAETLIEQARREGWSDPGLAAATVGRPIWWTLTPTPWSDLQTILAAARENSGAAEVWQKMAILGVSTLAPEDPSRAAARIACVCLIDSSPRTRIDHAVDMLRFGSTVAAQRKAHPPADYLAQAGTALAIAGVLPDPQTFVAQIRTRLNQDHAQTTTSPPA